MLERAAVHGGTSSMSGGHFYLGGGTAVQRATGQADSPDAMFDYLMAVTPSPDAAKIRLYADESAAHWTGSSPRDSSSSGRSTRRRP
ncbi:hypothetical protein [Nocardioides sp. B-3]|uniref:hypothetical protein n=1 Tax=Nocardioides sp. B-3 TaxID=2895565 RepID=UPI002152E02E|nr:hypothetical protein [Nocardioides sp. B-3]UUZ61940.1 hypothetical protein LP418_09515 [Nocardioides sp. B-3]